MIFISYRKSDSPHLVSRLEDDLVGKFGRDKVFRDKNGLHGGDQWPDELEQQAKSCSVMLVVIGSAWSTSKYEEGELAGHVRLTDPRDWVRREINASLDAGQLVIPLLIDDVSMPSQALLRLFGVDRLSSIQAERVRDSDYAADLAKLISVIRRKLPQQFKAPSTTTAATGLSMFPPRPRRMALPAPIGREEELQWILDAKQDVLIVGQPGSGKTYLHQYLALQGKAFFAVGSDEATLSKSIIEHGPEVIVIDDAHLKPDLIDLLRRQRVELGAMFHLHANCWPNSENTVASRLEIDSGSILRLKPIPRKVMAKLINSLGISGPDSLLYVLLEQARGKPGLCVALVQACKTPDYKKVWTGEAISEQLLSAGSSLGSEIDREILARFSLGGDSGAFSSQIALHVQMPLAALRARIAELGAAGIIVEVGEDAIAVVPESLRGVLVRDIFYAGSPRPDIQGALENCANPVDATHVLIMAADRGAAVSRALLRERVVNCDNEKLWQHYAYLGVETAQEILRNFPSKIDASASGLLARFPEAALPELIRRDRSENTERYSRLVDVHRLISDWLSPWSETAESASRRAMLVDQLTALRAESPAINDGTLLRYAALVISPRISDTRSDPVDRMSIVIRRGIHGRETLDQIQALWPRVVAILPEGRCKEWSVFEQAISDWAWPRRSVEKSTVELDAFMRNCAKRMLSDLLVATASDRVRRHHIRWINDNAELGIDIPLDDLFDRIFEERDRAESWEVQQAAREIFFQETATKLFATGMEAAVKTLSAIEKDATQESMHGGWDRGYLYQIVARKVEDPTVWVEAMIASGIPSQYVHHFVYETQKREPAKFQSLLTKLMVLPAYNELAVRLLIVHAESTDPLLVDTIDNLKPLTDNNDFRFQYPDIPVETMLRLLGHTDPLVRDGAAMGEWQQSPEHVVRASLMSAWKQVVAEATPRHDSSFEAVFAAHPDVGFEWALRAVNRGGSGLWKYLGTIAALAPRLSLEQKRALLGRMNEYLRFDEDWFDLIVGENYELYGEWLDATADKFLRVLPLRRKPSERWEKFALVAFDHGMRPDEIADYVGGWSESWSGSGSAHFQQYVGAYEKMLRHNDARFHIIARRGLEWARDRVSREKTREEEEEL